MEHAHENKDFRFFKIGKPQHNKLKSYLINVCWSGSFMFLIPPANMKMSTKSFMKNTTKSHTLRLIVLLFRSLAWLSTTPDYRAENFYI